MFHGKTHYFYGHLMSISNCSYTIVYISVVILIISGLIIAHCCILCPIFVIGIHPRSRSIKISELRICLHEYVDRKQRNIQWIVMKYPFQHPLGHCHYIPIPQLTINWIFTINPWYPWYFFDIKFHCISLYLRHAQESYIQWEIFRIQLMEVRKRTKTVWPYEFWGYPLKNLGLI